jgi:hypothetical protein
MKNVDTEMKDGQTEANAKNHVDNKMKDVENKTKDEGDNGCR